MSRAEIASYLGMGLESVSRAFSKLQRLSFISVDKPPVALWIQAGSARLMKRSDPSGKLLPQKLKTVPV